MAKFDLKKIVRGGQKYVIYIAFGAVVLVFGTFAAWEVSQLVSPTSISTGNGRSVTLKSSDHRDQLFPTGNRCANKIPLDNFLAGPDQPCYTDTSSRPVPLKPDAGNFNLFRIQGEILYR